MKKSMMMTMSHKSLDDLRQLNGGLWRLLNDSRTCLPLLEQTAMVTEVCTGNEMN